MVSVAKHRLLHFTHWVDGFAERAVEDRTFLAQNAT